MDTALPHGVVPAPGPRYVHDALFYSSPDELAAATVPFVEEGLAAGDAVVVIASPATADVVRTAVDDDRVRVLAWTEAYARRTPAAVTAFRRLADEFTATGARRVRVVGETDFGCTEREQLEWQRYEAVVNHALADWPLWGLCLFDTTRLPEPVLESVTRTHPTVVVAGRSRTPNPRFVDPAAYLRGLPVPVEPLQDGVPRLAVDDVSDPIALRHVVAAELAAVGGVREVVEDFLLAVDETTSNAIRHGAPPVGLRLWTSADRVVCAVTDHGPGLDTPFAGYGPAHGEDLSRGGMGVWLARQLCDHVDISCGPDGVTVRLTTALH